MSRSLHAMFDKDAAKATGISYVAAEYARMFCQAPTKNIVSGRFVTGPEAVIRDMENLTFKDEFDAIMAGIHDELPTAQRTTFDEMAKAKFTPRDPKVLEQMLREHLAVDLNGDHIQGAIGKVIVGHRIVGTRIAKREMLHSILARRQLALMGHDVSSVPRLAEMAQEPIWWPIYAGEAEERGRSKREPGDMPLDELPSPHLLMALNTNESYAAAAAANDARTAKLDEGTAHGILQGLSGAQPVDPDASVTGTLGATWVLGSPAFGASTDAAPGAQATAAAIADVTIGATITLGYMAASSSDTNPTRKNCHMEGDVGSTGTAGVDYDWVFNTLSFVSGATGSITNWTVTQGQGPTAT